MSTLATLVTAMLLTASSAWSQTTQPSSTPGEAGSPPWLESYWMIILIFAVVAAGLAYFSFRKRRSR